jgi:antitoxin component YwqK of YwqJK toxin-antitoxin module
MGTSPSLIERKDYYDTGELEYHVYMFNKELCGLCRHYYKNGELRSLSNQGDYYLSKRMMCFYENGMLERETCSYDKHKSTNAGDTSTTFDKKMYDEKMYDEKMYDEQGLLCIHSFYTNLYLWPSTYYHAEYVNGSARKLSLYYLEYFELDNHVKNIIYNTTDTSYEMIINVTIINSIRIIQKQFRKRTYSKRFDILNSVICINDISRVILLYL